MTEDTRFDEMIARAARELDAPADPPRDAMWSAAVLVAAERLSPERDLSSRGSATWNRRLEGWRPRPAWSAARCSSACR